MKRKILTASRTESHHTFRHEYYFDPAGVARWASNDSAISLSVASEYGIEVNHTLQEECRIRELSDTIAQFLKHQAENGYSEEEKAEMKAVFGAEAELINVLSGERIKL